MYQLTQHKFWGVLALIISIMFVVGMVTVIGCGGDDDDDDNNDDAAPTTNDDVDDDAVSTSCDGCHSESGSRCNCSFKPRIQPSI